MLRFDVNVKKEHSPHYILKYLNIVQTKLYSLQQYKIKGELVNQTKTRSILSYGSFFVKHEHK